MKAAAPDTYKSENGRIKTCTVTVAIPHTMNHIPFTLPMPQ
jgi:hypothetical protein